MARPRKKGLSYFPKDVDYYDDFKIMDLINAYGPLGLAVYDIILSSVYREGYYLEIEIDKLALKAIRIIGNRWVKSKDLVLDVIHYCAEIGLIDKTLLMQNVVTSPGIQRRYSEATVRNKVETSKYWLIGEQIQEEFAQPVLNTPSDNVSVTKTLVSATETPFSVSNIQQRKEKKIKEKESKREYTDFVRLTHEEYETLIQKYGHTDTQRCLSELSLWKKSKGITESKCDYADIERWVIHRVQELKKKGKYKDQESSFDVNVIERESMEIYRK
jgi:hypothetical protein